MPNWAMGTIEVTGKESGVISFVERFSDWHEPAVPGKKYFARSIVDEDRSKLIKRIRYENHGRPKDINIQVDFEASFAWSAYSCLVSGYPQAATDPECWQEYGVFARKVRPTEKHQDWQTAAYSPRCPAGVPSGKNRVERLLCFRQYKMVFCPCDGYIMSGRKEDICRVRNHPVVLPMALALFERLPHPGMVSPMFTGRHAILTRRRGYSTPLPGRRKKQSRTN